MPGHIYHVGLTVSDTDRSVKFYKDILGLDFIGELLMEGEETEKMFCRRGCRARVSYLNKSDDPRLPPVELIEFLDEESRKTEMDIFTTSVSELCFFCEDADKTYEHLIKNGVYCFSPPQLFDFTKDGFGKSKAFYFRDPDGIILEAMQPL